MVNNNETEQQRQPSVSLVYQLLEAVKDPEIPVLSIVDLGIITDVVVHGQNIVVEMTPTFTGCPAIDMIRSDIVEELGKNGFGSVTVNLSFREVWSSDKISERGRLALRKFGLAPPPQSALFTDLDILEHATCPRCEGSNTEMRSPFGSTLCRSIHFCNTCRDSFEQFKPI